MNDETWKHGATLASAFGCLLQFTTATVKTGSSFDDEEHTVIAVYPKRYEGMGGGMLKAAMDQAPVFEFELSDEEQANDIAAAFNFFAAEGRVQ